MGAATVDFHDTAQGITDDIMRYRSISLNCRHFDDTWKRIKTVLRVISDLDPQIDGRTQCVKISFVALIESPYTTLYQTVRTGNGLNWSEVA